MILERIIHLSVILPFLILQVLGKLSSTSKKISKNVVDGCHFVYKEKISSKGKGKSLKFEAMTPVSPFSGNYEFIIDP